MARKLDVRGRRPENDSLAGEADGGPVGILGYAGNPVIGTAASDFLLAQDASTINGGGGDDFILGDIGPFGTAQNGNGSFATAYPFDFVTHLFSTVENPLFADDSIPHATVYVQGENQQEYFAITVGAGQTLTIDIDGAGGTVGSAVHTDTVVELFAAGDLVTPVASNDDADAGLGGYGSEAHFGSPGVPGGVDSFLVFTNNGAAATYYIRIREFGLDANFETDDEFLLNLSLTGYATGGTTLQHGDAINGEAGNDHLYAGAGNDILNGGSGLDFMVGGTGDDLYIVDDPSDFVVEVAGEGNDRISARSSFLMSPDASIETLTYFDDLDQVALQFSGSSTANTITSANGNDLLRGLGGNDTLNGLGGNDQLDGGTGADVMNGGAQSDTYVVDDIGDVIVEFENLNGGSDLVYALISWQLAPGSSVETLSPQDWSTTTPFSFTGNEFGNLIFGNAGANFLNGAAGADELTGFGGDDIYVVDNAGDRINEAQGAGFDYVYALVDYTLSSGASVEALSAIDWTFTNALNLTGNELANPIYGNAGANTLNGAGGPDELTGFGGNDTYVVDNVGDKINEAIGAGSDAVYALVDYTLSSGASVEMLSAIDWSHTTPLNLTGNELDNPIYGNAGANTLNGAGGADTLMGFGGDDLYVADNAGDAIVESAGQGNDTVYALVSYALNAGAVVETLTTIDWSGTGALNLTGNEFANSVFGNAGNNTLNGGAGSDSLRGFSGADTFAFTTALGAGNIDTIVDFSVVDDDTIAIDDAVFAGLGPGPLNASAFRTGSAAQDADDRIIYNSATGQLFHDADGSAAGAAVQFATVTPGVVLTAADFVVI